MKKRLIGSLLFGALVVSSSSVFVSCADYDDDINANKAEIQAVQTELNKLTSDLTALQTQLTSTKNDLQNELTAAKSEFETKIANAKAELQAAIDAKASQSEVDALSAKLANLQEAYTAKVASLESQIAQINTSLEAINNLIAQKADKSELTAAIATLQAAIDKKVDTETYNQAVALIAQLQTNLSNLQTLVDTKASKEYVDGEVTKLNAAIATLQAALEGKVAATEFAALKSNLEALQTAVAGLQAVAANAATKDELNAAKSELSATIATLQTQVNGLVTPDKLQDAINALKNELTGAINGKANATDVAALQTAVAALQEAMGKALSQADLDLLRTQLEQAIKENKGDADAKIQALQDAIDALAAGEKADIDDVVALIAALSSDTDAQFAAAKADTEAKLAALEDEDAQLAALIAALTTKATDLQSQIDELKAGKADKAALDAAVSDLTQAKSDVAQALAAIAGITGDIDAINAKYEALIASIASSGTATDATITALNSKIDGLENGKVADNAAAIIALQTQQNALAAFLGELTEGGLAAQLEAVKQAMSTEAQNKLNAEIADRIAAINEVVGKINDVKSDLASLDSKLYDAETGDITKLKAQFATIDTKIQEAIDENLASLKLYIQRMLSSVTLIPKLYVGGIEAIEFKSVQYLEVEQCNSNGVHGSADHTGTSTASQEPQSANQSTFKVFGWTHIKNATWRYLGNEEAEAYYRISPAHLDAAAFIKEEIEVIANKALTRVADPLTQSPVEVVKNRTEYNPEEGIVKIYLKKANWFQGRDLNSYGLDTSKGEIYTVSLRVPRSADYMPTDEDGEAIAKYVYSEFSRLDEVKIRPYIAELWETTAHKYTWRYNSNYHHTYYSNQFTNDAGGVTPYGDKSGWGGSSTANHGLNNKATQWQAFNGTYVAGYGQHFLDSATIFRSKVDNDEYVKARILYSRTGSAEFCLNDVVTGCYDNSVGRTQGEQLDANGKHQQITADELKQFGIAFRFAIPATYYGNYTIQDVDHVTNQNKFALIRYDANTGKSYIRSTYVTANGQTPIDARNAASVGKEPIVRISLVDTVNNRLIDQRYMKIKWTENVLEPVKIDDYTQTLTLGCSNVTSSIQWSWFINKVYAVCKENEGLSQSTFDGIYPVPTNVTISLPSYYNVIAKKNTKGGFDATPATANQPIVANTTNENGDAYIATWTLTPDDIQRVYRGSRDDKRTFVAQVYFKSNTPTEHPDMYFNWYVTIELPDLPEINGFYDDYWIDPQAHTAHHVLPIQWVKNNGAQDKYGRIQGTNPADAEVYVPGYDKTKNLVDGASDYCVFDNNLMNAFTYESVGGVTKFIVKNLSGCGTWDLQFRPQQNVLTSYGPGWFNDGYNNDNFNTPNASSDAYFNKKATHKVARQTIRDFEPKLTPDNWYDFQAYKFYLGTTSSAQSPNTLATQLVWDDGHVAWCGKNAHKYANIASNHIEWTIDKVDNDGYPETYKADNTTLLGILNKLSDENEADGWTPKFVDEKPINMGVWGTVNAYNHVPVWFYNIYMVEPLRVNATLNGAFEDGWSSGTAVSYDGALTMNDFRGYLVANVADGSLIRSTDNNVAKERKSYTKTLHTYYEVMDPIWDLKNVKYGFSNNNGTLVPNPNSKLTAEQIEKITNGNIVLSVTNNRTAKELVFKNNGGSNVTEQVTVFIPVTVYYGLGKVTREVQVQLYPAGKGPAGQIKAATARQR